MSDNQIEKAEQVLEELKIATREARECLKDFKGMVREYNAIMFEWKINAQKRIDSVVKEGLDNYQGALLEATEKGSQAVFARFDKLYDLLTTGGDHTQPSIPELIQAKVDRENEAPQP
jgi:hypothetical protein